MIIRPVIISGLMLAFALGGIIGYFREKASKNAGLRTHILVCVGTTLFTLSSIEFWKLINTADPSRITAAVVTAVGFLGAGAIIQAGGDIKGLTTAASVWITAAIGLALGIGFYDGAVFGTIITIVTLQLLHKLESKIIKTKGSKD